MFIQQVPSAIYASSIMISYQKTVFLSAARSTANQTLMALIYTIENNLYLDYAICLF